MSMELTRHERTGGAQRGRAARGGSAIAQREPSAGRTEPELEVTRHTPMRTVLASLVALSALSLSACGTETGEPDEPAAKGEWSQQTLKGRPGADAPVGFAADGDDVLVAVLSENATLTTYLSRDGGDFVTGEPIAVEGGGYPGFADPVRLDGTWWLIGTGGMIGEGNDEEMAFEPRILRSDDGLTWEPVEVSGIPAPIDLNAVAATGAGLVAVGTKRNGVDGSGRGSFEAVTWRSEDGSAWTEVPLPGVVPEPGYRSESNAYRVVSASDRLLAGGSVSQQAALWASEDAGASWSRVVSPEIDDLYQVYGLTVDGPTVLLSGSLRDETEGRLLVSTDSGRTFRAAQEQVTAGAEGGQARLWSGSGRFFTFTEPNYDVFTDPAVCYADFDQCGHQGDQSGVGYIHASDDGDLWSVVDTSELDLGDELVGVVGAADGGVSFAHQLDGILITSWRGGSALPEGGVIEEPERIELVTVPEGEDPEPGVRYHAPMHVHCGMEWLYLGGTPWQRSDGGPDVETGAGDDPSADWPMAGETIYGYATLGDDGVVRYSIGGEGDEVIATYEQTGAKPPGCD